MVELEESEAAYVRKQQELASANVQTEKLIAEIEPYRALKAAQKAATARDEAECKLRQEASQARRKGRSC